ncbi:BppU family phage baseplate upper protein [Bacillus cereus]|uniref:BppU family phage baseplate upper protein n=1 Tax=Bacillus cereus group TaxID=86661 RepID=UPI001BABE469|nr:BppU family phage baseplate upper protein [Bacillus cereus]MBR9655795.1 hypothetical protein [Bacillus cereus]
MAFTGDYLRVSPIELSLLGCDSLITCSPLVRLGDKGETVIRVKIHNAPDYLDVKDYGLAFEANVGGKLIQDENMTRFRVIDKTTFEYLCADEVHSFVGSVNVAYFVLTRETNRVTTQNFTLHSLANAEQNTDGLKEHYVSVIDDLIETNKDAIKKAQEIEDMINKNQVVKKSGDTMTGNLIMDQNVDNSVISLRFHEKGIPLTSFGINRGKGIYYDQVNGASIFGYDPATREFVVSANTNLVKKTGDTMTGDLRLNRVSATGNRYLRYVSDTEAEYSLGVNSSGNFHMLDVKSGGNVFEYNISRKELNVPVATNLLKKTDIYTGWVSPDGRSKSINDTDLNTVIDSGIYTGQRLINAPENITNFFFYVEVLPYTNNSYRLQRATLLNHVSQRVWFRTLIAGNWQPWVELTPNSRDGKAVLQLTSEVTSSSTTASQLATRRGNSVTLTFDVIRKIDSTSPIITTLPEGYRPTDTINMTAFSTEMKPSRLMLRFNGEVHLADNTSKGQRYMFMTTFVTN